MLRMGIITMGLTFVCSGVGRADPAAQPEQIKSLIGKLGDRSFKNREEATRKLEALGKSASASLEEGLKSGDPETIRRCRRLLELAQRTDTEVALALYMEKKDDTRLMKLPSWDRFCKLMGKDDAAKKMFVDIYCAEGTLMSEMERVENDYSSKFIQHVQKVQQSIYTPWGQANPLPHHQIVALLFLATDPRAGKDINSFYMMSNLFYQPTIQQGFRENAGSRKLLVAFLEQRNTPQTAQQVFQIAKQVGLKEAVPMAVKIVGDKSIPGYTRGMAVLSIGQMGGPEHKKDLEKLLDDKTALGSVRTGTATINAQMRDVALAAMIQLSGQSLTDYSFPYMQQFRGIRADANLPPYYFGFSDDAGREAAIKKFRASQEPAKKEEPKDKPKTK